MFALHPIHKEIGVSKDGRIFSHRSGKWRELTPTDNGRGYKTVSMGRSHPRAYIHRLVAETHIPNPDHYKEINHIDGDKSNNSVDNLEWCDRSHNLKHSYANGLHDHTKAVKAMKRSHAKPVRIVETGQVFESVTDCARYLGTFHGNINECLNPAKKRHTAKGYHFEYVKEGE